MDPDEAAQGLYRVPSLKTKKIIMNKAAIDAECRTSEFSPVSFSVGLDTNFPNPLNFEAICYIATNN